MGPFEASLRSIFTSAGVTINGNRPWDVRVVDERFYRRVVLHGSLGLGESYLEGWWSCADLEELFYRIVRAGLHRRARRLPIRVLGRLIAGVVNQQTRVRSLRVARRHYDLGNDLFFAFLGRYKNYSCGYFEGVDSLEEAQLQKMEKICRELDLKEGDRLLDVGGGWGEFARYAASAHGCQVTSINISREQIEHARRHCAGLGVEIRRCDYRDIQGRYDKIAAIAMLTHVGKKNYRVFMETMHRCLAPGGLMLIETVGGHSSVNDAEAWIGKYIFPGGMVPSLEQIDRAASGLFVRSRLSEFGASYVRTLRAWHDNLQKAWPRLRMHYDEATRVMFEYFFLSVAGAFRARDLTHWHLVLERSDEAAS